MADTATIHAVTSERIAAALRNSTAEGFDASSPYAACLLPLLEALGWRHYTRELIEALPHFAKRIELVDLRNILVTLGYQCAPIKTRIETIKPELYPCLFLFP
jgi:ATP-binding cassette subfamily C protein LapB